MFWLKKEARSPRQIYEEKLEQLRVEAVENWEYVYVVDERHTMYLERTIEVLVWYFNNKSLWDFEIREWGKYTWHKLLILENYIEIEKQKKKAEEMELQRQEDEEYREKLRKLLEIKPLDADLKRSLKKTERLLEIAEEYKSLEKEMFELRN